MLAIFGTAQEEENASCVRQAKKKAG